MQPFVVKLNDLKSGVTRFDWIADDEFFGKFENPEVLGASVEAAVKLVNRGVTVDAECVLTGTITVPCDRCLEDLVLPVETSFEETYTPDSDEFDLSQDVYDFVMTSLPMQKVHAEGECNEETTKYLSK